MANLKIAILCYKSDQVGTWDPDTVNTGLPGSEEAVVYASEALAKLSHTVHVFANPDILSSWKDDKSNPRWFDVEDIKRVGVYYNIVVLWRQYDVMYARQFGKKVFIWLHDIPRTNYSYIFPPADGALLLSKFHYNTYDKWINFKTVKYRLCGNGVKLEQFPTPRTYENPYRIGYFSNYARGLKILLGIWYYVLDKFPKAELHICYGKQTWGLSSESEMHWMMSKIEEYKSSIVHHGKVGHQELANIMQETSIWSYPCTTSDETFCITAIKCQLAGCVPVTTRIGALDETVHPDAPSVNRINNDSDIEQYKNLLIHVMTNIGDYRAARQNYIDFASKFTWDACVDQWISLYDEQNYAQINL